MNTAQSLLAMLLLGTAAQVQAQSNSASITVTGKVLPGTCTLTDVPVTLDEIDATDFKNGHDNKLKPAALNLTGCVGVTSVELTFDGTADPAQDGYWQNLAASNRAEGVAVTLMDGPTGIEALLKGSKKTVPINGGATGKLEMRAGYYRKSGTLLKAGEVSTSITVTAVYK
jgi:type 1 fimbria pilin